MKKLTTILSAGVLALSLGGLAFAQTDQEKQQQEYQAALKKCDSLPAAEKQPCIDAAKKKHGQM